MNGRWRIGRWLAMVALVLCLGWTIFAAASIWGYASNMDTAQADAAIVLGAAVWDGRPSPVFEERIKHAIELHRSGQVASLIFTGGLGKDDQLSEAEVARRYALDAGVQPEVILCETASTTTLQNLSGAYAIVKREHLGRVLIVSDPLHMRRAITLARDLGLDAYPSPTPTTRYTGLQAKAGFLLREVYFYSVYLLRRAVGWGGE
jgi:uncharacterized SAM-binding protein YcdF (DUF218 family)